MRLEDFAPTSAATAVSHLRATGINDADLAEIAGHRVETMLARYAHPVGVSLDAIRSAID